MTKKKKTLMELLLDNVTPDTFKSKYAVCDKSFYGTAIAFYSSHPLFDYVDGEWSADDFEAEIPVKEESAYWKKSIVTRDEFIKAYEEKQKENQVKTPLEFALEKFGTDWHENVGVQPVEDNVIVDVILRDNSNHGMFKSQNLRWKRISTISDILKWRVHSDAKEFPDESRIDAIGQNGGDGEHYDVVKTKSVENTITERGKRYGRFEDGAVIMQQLKEIAHKSQAWKRMQPIQKEGMEMILHKIGRILNGDPDYADNWHDISGFSKLVDDWLNGDSK